jgi:hypothetical protein
VIPALHEGGVHDAVTAALPTPGAVTFPMLPKLVLVPLVTPTEIGLLVLQVRGTPIKGIPTLSVTVAFTVADVPLLSVIGDAPALSTLRVIDCTGQVVKGRGWLFTLPTLAKINAEPGLPAVAICWLRDAVTPGEANTTGLVADVCPGGNALCHVNGPTEDVMSVDPLKAKASYSVLSGFPEGARFDRQLVESVGGWFGCLLITTLVTC